ncbi:glutamate receptor 2.7-like [Salvia hispanica]|uniref:glutamate receptor 2.7-like n=1 Tax=Salvia hispanica TaxID=49212 RepID=UPI00200939B6|nr:glutamate receptor 2.7-like [Salvia hispanica]XP_047959746.1 glutamate receptor 2.7-like [Salvia hispanica]XP_047959747.1 glutamate receptor 2.7-like [Salvia hispanica]XP_047959748.1 glutamate receptor 2.7-like [Salvia hispanica]
MAIEDFYSNRDHTTMIVPHFRNSGTDAVGAASAAIELLKNTQVMAILGPQRSVQADFVIDIGDKVKVPVISPSISPTLSSKELQYFIRSAWCSSSQAKAIAAVVKAFGWKEVTLVYEDSNYGSGLVPVLAEEMLNSNVLLSKLSAVSPSAKHHQLFQQLQQLKTLQTRVFVVVMLPNLASRFFQMAEEAGMMAEGYAWIISDVLTSLLDSVDSETIEAMQGVLGVRPYIPRSHELSRFTKRWRRRFHEENPEMDRTELNVFGLWAYDSTTAIADSVERVGVASPRFKKPGQRWNLTDLEAIGTSNSDPSLVHLIRNYKSKGLSGDFHINNGQLQASAIEIVNVVGAGANRVGFWTERYGISQKLQVDDPMAVYSTKKDDLGGVVWPGRGVIMPIGWEVSTNGNKLKVGVANRSGFPEFTRVERNSKTNAVEATGFCVDVFKQVMESLPYDVPYEFFLNEYTDHQKGGDYSDISNINNHSDPSYEKYDIVVGDFTITANRSELLDFTIPYTESGVAVIVPIKANDSKNAWIFMKPLTTGLWLTAGAFFFFTGFVVWALEHRVNEEFQGPPLHQVGTAFWFSFSTIVFAHRERLVSNLTRFVVIIWMFVMLVLNSSYTASLASMLTVQQLQPAITDIHDLIKEGEYVGYQNGSFVTGLLRNMNFDTSKFRSYQTLEEYDVALSKGSRNGGVAAVVDELPYIRMFLSKYCRKYTMIGPIYQTSGFGFAFQKGSPLVDDVSKAILRLKENEEMERISRKWFKEGGCRGSDGATSTVNTQSLSADSFKGLFLVAGLSSSLALAIFVSKFAYENRCILNSAASTKLKIHDLARAFYQKKDSISEESLEGRVSTPSPEPMTPIL